MNTGLRSSKTKKSVKKSTYNPQFELKIKELIRELEVSGYTVRREELKKGLGWKVASGACRVFEDKLLFVDRSMSQLEQIEFLSSKLSPAA